MKNSLIIGTRGSKLALWQAEFIKAELERVHPDLQVELKIIKTTGDAVQNRSLVGLGKGVFTKEIEAALLVDEIDIAVHSLKDLPTELPEGLCVIAIPNRTDPRDVLITASQKPLKDLPEGAIIGTTSPRRKGQLLNMRRDLEIVEVRGNIDTRLRKLQETDVDGIMLAAAGIKRLLDPALITQYFEVEEMVPAVGQGAIGIEAREGDTAVANLLEPLNDHQALAEITAERAVLETLGGGCSVPIGAHATQTNGKLDLISSVSHPEGESRIVEKGTGSPDAAQDLGESVAEKLKENGATELLQAQEI